MIGCREIYIETTPILHVLVTNTIHSVSNCFFGDKEFLVIPMSCFFVFTFPLYQKSGLNIWHVLFCSGLFHQKQLTLTQGIHIFINSMIGIAIIPHVFSSVYLILFLSLGPASGVSKLTHYGVV